MFSTRSTLVSPLVETSWLEKQLQSKTVIPMDCSWHMPNEKRNAHMEYLAEHIPGAVFFDIDEHSDHSTSLPHMLPSVEQFEEAMRSLDVTNDQHVVLYDQSNVYSAFRVYWMLWLFGHERVSLLNGGLRKWKLEGKPLLGGNSSERPSHALKREVEPYRVDPRKVRFQEGLKTYEQILTVSKEARSKVASPSQIVDLRSKERFSGQTPEPRPQLPSGHMPCSVNAPFQTFMDVKSHTLLKPEQLKQIFEQAGISKDQEVIFSCGSGVTACVGFFAAKLLGYEEAAVYDGSWSEYASRPESVIIASAK